VKSTKDPGDETSFYGYETKIIGIYDRYDDAYKVAFKMACKFGYAVTWWPEQQNVLFKGLGECHDDDDCNILHHGVLTLHYIQI